MTKVARGPRRSGRSSAMTTECWWSLEPRLEVRPHCSRAPGVISWSSKRA